MTLPNEIQFLPGELGVRSDMAGKLGTIPTHPIFLLEIIDFYFKKQMSN